MKSKVTKAFHYSNECPNYLGSGSDIETHNSTSEYNGDIMYLDNIFETDSKEADDMVDISNIDEEENYEAD
ncbi:hypothetical protein CU097_003981 [Rhizopus azygosporus]|uniref:Uncharacterized protein n=1 Tax=Rhizopus azygosporus TaxID=86630 RepID=A0A367JR20_RHIAZ|nr:hypothetical protein CU097_003981 [Rhizopus azygosporus]